MTTPMLAGEPIDVAVLARMPVRLLLNRRLVPIQEVDEAILVAAAEPPTAPDVAFLRRLYGMPIEIRLVDAREIEAVREAVTSAMPRRALSHAKPAPRCVSIEPAAEHGVRDGAIFRWLLIGAALVVYAVASRSAMFAWYAQSD